jgi:thioester reductase-like protein
MEDELDEGQAFRNACEETKFQAELLMREAMKSDLPVSIYRPSFVVGDTKTGEIGKLAGPYFMISALLMAPSRMRVPLPGRGETPLNLVPIDFVCEALYAISQMDDTAGHTFHISDPNPLAARKVAALFAESAGRPIPRAKLPYRMTAMLLRAPWIERLARSPRQFLEDFNQLTIFNAINTQNALKGSLACPPLTTYVNQLVTHVRENELALQVDLSEMEDIIG